MQMQILDITKLMDEKKEAVAAQYAAEATLRRVYAEIKKTILFNPVELIIAPLEAELKMHKNEVTDFITKFFLEVIFIDAHWSHQFGPCFRLRCCRRIRWHWNVQ